MRYEGRPISGRNITWVGGNVSRLYITEFCQRVIEVARHRVRSGQVSERGLARLASISQPHLHNVLKGIRVLSPDAADRLMRAMDVTVPQVLWSGGTLNIADISAVPVLRNRIGPGTVAAFDAFRGYRPFPAAMVAALTDPVAAFLAADLALPADFRAGDLALLDQDPAVRTASPAASCWIVADSGGLRVRYVRRTRAGLEVGSDRVVSERVVNGQGSSDAGKWQPISLQGRNILEIVRARIVWIGREIETPLAGPTWPAGSGD